MRVARQLPHEDGSNLTGARTTENSSVAEDLLRIEEESYSDEGETEKLDSMEVVLPEDACGVFNGISRVYKAITHMHWEDAYVLGGSL